MNSKTLFGDELSIEKLQYYLLGAWAAIEF